MNSRAKRGGTESVRLHERYDALLMCVSARPRYTYDTGFCSSSQAMFCIRKKIRISVYTSLLQ